MDLYTTERLFLDRLAELRAAGERMRMLQSATRCEPPTVRVRVASWLRAAADRLDGAPSLHRVV